MRRSAYAALLALAAAHGASAGVFEGDVTFFAITEGGVTSGPDLTAAFDRIYTTPPATPSIAGAPADAPQRPGGTGGGPITAGMLTAGLPSPSVGGTVTDGTLEATPAAFVAAPGAEADPAPGPAPLAAASPTRPKAAALTAAVAAEVPLPAGLPLAVLALASLAIVARPRR